MTTPNTWPEGTAPTTAQLLEYVRVAEDYEVTMILDQLLTAAVTAHRCRTMDHDYAMRQLTAAQADATRWAILVDTEATTTEDTTRILGETAARLIEEAQA